MKKGEIEKFLFFSLSLGGVVGGGKSYTQTVDSSNSNSNSNSSSVLVIIKIIPRRRRWRRRKSFGCVSK